MSKRMYLHVTNFRYYSFTHVLHMKEFPVSKVHFKDDQSKNDSPLNFTLPSFTRLISIQVRE